MKSAMGIGLRSGTALAAALLSTPLLAAHFTFQVPYEFHRLGPDVKAVRINCVVFDDSNHSLGSGYKTASINRNTGEASGTLSIAFDADAGNSAFDASHYRCQLTRMWVVGVNPPWQAPTATTATGSSGPIPLRLLSAR